MSGRTLDRSATADEIRFLFEVIIGRPLADDSHVAALVGEGVSLANLIVAFRNSEELRATLAHEHRAVEGARQRDVIAASSQDDRAAVASSLSYRAPPVLARSGHGVERILMIGSCQSEQWQHVGETLAFVPNIELHLFNAGLPEEPLLPVDRYGFQVLQLPLRLILPDQAFARLDQDDEAGHARLFDHAVEAMQWLLHNGMRWNREHGLLSFVLSLPTPQQNPVGRLFPRYSLTNPVFFIEQLNRHLAESVDNHANSYFVEIDAIAATLGRKALQEDALAAFNHGALLGNHDYPLDRDRRLEPVVRATDLYGDHSEEFIAAAWHELLGLYRTVRRIDAVKLVVVDLDDTLWRGTIGETAVEDMPTSEGWPKGLWEALAILKRRGIMLAIISKNDEGRVRDVWDTLLARALSLDDFAAIRINWEAKSLNLAAILADINVLPSGVLYIDDNPAQRHEVQRAFPDVRVLGGNPISWRQVLLWAPETQVATVTPEAARRTAMVHAQIARERDRQAADPSEFFASLNIEVRSVSIRCPDAAGYRRSLELINKTNQFNTSGRRWAHEEMGVFLASGGHLAAFEVSDIYTDYGLVMVAIVHSNRIEQMVMSCRVGGIGVEAEALASIFGTMREVGITEVTASTSDTGRNLPWRDVYRIAGFELLPGESGGYHCWRKVISHATSTA